MLNKLKSTLVLAPLLLTSFTSGGIKQDASKPTCEGIRVSSTEVARQNSYDYIKAKKDQITIAGRSFLMPIKDKRPNSIASLYMDITVIPATETAMEDFYCYTVDYIHVSYMKNPTNQTPGSPNFCSQKRTRLKSIGPLHHKDTQNRFNLKFHLDSKTIAEYGFLVFEHWTRVINRITHQSFEARSSYSAIPIGYELNNRNEEHKVMCGRKILGRRYTYYSKKTHNYCGFCRTYKVTSNDKVPNISNGSTLDLRSFIYHRKYTPYPYYDDINPPDIPRYNNVEMWLEIFGKDHNIFYQYRKYCKYDTKCIKFPIKIVPFYDKDKQCCVFDKFTLEFAFGRHIRIDNVVYATKHTCPIPRHDPRLKDIKYRFVIRETDDSVGRISVPLDAEDYQLEMAGILNGKYCVVVADA